MSQGKYGDLIRQARQPENQNTKTPDSQTTRQPDNQIARQPDSQTTRQLEPENPIEEAEPEVNLCVKVPISLRRHWSAEAKRTGVTMTSVIIEALTEQFGKPE